MEDEEIKKLSREEKLKRILDSLEDKPKIHQSLIGGFVSVLTAVGVGAIVLEMMAKNLKKEGIIDEGTMIVNKSKSL